jgi:hypothetical protein
MIADFYLYCDFCRYLPFRQLPAQERPPSGLIMQQDDILLVQCILKKNWKCFGWIFGELGLFGSKNGISQKKSIV